MPADEAKELRIKRGTLKSKLTHCQQILGQITAETDLTTINPALRLEKLEVVWNEFEPIQSRLDFLSIADEDSDEEDSEQISPQEIKERTDFEDKYFSLTGQLKKLVQSLTPQSHTNSAASTLPSANTSVNEENTISANIKLPVINLPTFSGGYDTWLGFSDTFNSIVHENNKIADIQKLHYLRSCLQGDSAEVIAALETSAANYAVAWKLITDRYNNPRYIIESHTKALIELPNVSKDFSIRALVDYVQKHMRALTALKVPVDKWDTILILIIQSKLNHVTREKWEDLTAESTLPKFQEFITFLQRRAQFKETRVAQSSNKSSSNNHNKLNANNGKKSFSQHTLVATQSKMICFFCQGNHTIYVCEDFLKLSINQR